MELEIGNEYIYYEKPETYVNELEQFNIRIEFLLDEFIKNYVIARMNPNNEDLQKIYKNITSNISQLQGKIFSISNEIQNNTNNINEKLTELDVLIRREKGKNKNLRKQLGMVENQNISASEMITDYGEIYDRNYLRNWGLFISTIICIFTMRSMYNNPIV